MEGGLPPFPLCSDSSHQRVPCLLFPFSLSLQRLSPQVAVKLNQAVKNHPGSSVQPKAALYFQEGDGQWKKGVVLLFNYEPWDLQLQWEAEKAPGTIIED